ncbi:MAG: hypothetical protein EOO75_15905, partial [Myxococcales bacterium]
MVAESELPDGSAAPDDRPLQDVQTRHFRDQRTGVIVPARELLEHPGRCKDHFLRTDGTLDAPDWESFKRDVAFFRVAMWGNYWRDAVKSHGYVGSPARTLLGRVMIPPGELTEGRMQALAAIDPALWALMFALVAWAFGGRVMAVTIVFWGTQDLAPFYWQGGAFREQDWLLCLIAAVCLARRRRFAASAALLALGAWLHVLPAAFLAGPVVLLAASLVRRQPDRRLTRLLASAALTSTLVLGAVALSPDVPGWSAWVQHVTLNRHVQVTNTVGWIPLVSHRADNRMQVSKDPRFQDPFQRWRELHDEALQSRTGVFRGGQLLALALLVLACLRARRPWIALALGGILIPMFARVECYHAIALLPLCLLTRARPGTPRCGSAAPRRGARASAGTGPGG